MQKKILVVICSFIMAMAVFFCGWYVCNTLYQQTISQISNETSEDVKELRTQLAQAIFERNALIQANYDETSEEVQALDEKITSIKSQIEVLEGTLRAELAEALAERDALIKANYDETSAELQAVNARITELENQIEIANSNISNENLLINGDFRVNQRGQTSYTATSSLSYTVDRWAIMQSEGLATYDVSSKTITNNGTDTCSFVQIIEDTDVLWNQTLTVSFKVNDNIFKQTFEFSDKPTSSTTIGIIMPIFENQCNFRFYFYNTGYVGYTFDIFAGASIQIDWAKLEYGSIATSYNPRLYAEELALCQRYFIKNVSLVSCSYGLEQSIYVRISTPVTMRTLPTLLNSSTAFINGGGSYLGEAENIYVSGIFNNVIQLTVNHSNIQNSVIYVIDAYGDFDAEIY